MEGSRAFAKAINDVGSKYKKKPLFRSFLVNLIIVFMRRIKSRPLLSLGGHVCGLVTDQARLQLRIQMTHDGRVLYNIGALETEPATSVKISVSPLSVHEQTAQSATPVLRAQQQKLGHLSGSLPGHPLHPTPLPICLPQR
jgi:hypothetical protein